ncbi:YqiA/YcfP family alpha/beta fold hydrolase [Maridesulfovibrio hydrothermalis]|uniref:Esterase n=1 Tax=Maridesulfovibrio hydrothermalis AM13 = DSM 14728 TaxID=1121451 RepID=L0RAL4_9BACT|nr:YqiA/YcfP family alpha/beta fold hydrolase [Maridesulfovibrio hydrothermalis]CCO23794.1 conserved protein of unknown function [Maridesulfovibrio hydrothermalis AM13 = DSM 14728]
MKNIFLNIHGFGSSGSNSKAAALTCAFPDHKLISPDLPANPQESLSILDAIIKDTDNRPLIMQGSSMGGLYALVMHIRHNIPALLINPALTPATLVGNRLGEVYEFSNGDQIVISDEHVAQFAEVEKEIASGIAGNHIARNKVMALIGEQDELLDQEIMKGILRKAGAEIISYDTDHRFTGFDEVVASDRKVRHFLLMNQD